MQQEQLGDRDSLQAAVAASVEPTTDDTAPTPAEPQPAAEQPEGTAQETASREGTMQELLDGSMEIPRIRRGEFVRGVVVSKSDSEILVDQMLAWDNSLFRRDLGPVPEAIRDEVRRAVLEFLDLL